MKRTGIIIISLLFSLSQIVIKAKGNYEAFPSKGTLSNEICQKELKSILEKAAEISKIDIDSVSRMFPELRYYVSEEGCNDQWRALGYAYIANNLLAKYQTKAYLYDQRTPLAGYEPTNSDEWSSDLYLKNILSALNSSLEPTSKLNEKQASDYPDFITNASTAKSTLFSVLANNALDLLSSIQNLPIIGYAIQAPLNPDIYYLPRADFLRCVFDSSSTDIGSLKLRILQDLLKQADDSHDPDMIVETELRRFGAGMNDFTSLTNLKYTDALRSLYDEYQHQSVSLMIVEAYVKNIYYSSVGENHENDREKVQRSLEELIDLCRKALRKFPKAEYACNVQNLMNEILSQNFDAKIEPVNSPGKPISLSLGYYNIPSIELELSDQQNVIVWKKQIQLPDRYKYIRQEYEMEIPSQPLGEYTLKLWIPGKTKEEDVKMLKFATSSLFTLYQIQNDNLNFLVTDRISGRPVKGAVISLWENINKETEKKSGEYKTDSDGMLSIKMQKNTRYRFRTSYGKDFYSPETDLYTYSFQRNKNSEIRQQAIFTDRSVYKPGQTVYFKSISWIQKENGCEALSDTDVFIILSDNAGKQISKKQFITDAFGSVSGEFVLPKNGLNGIYQINSDNCTDYIQVADYKRPAFEVLLNKPSTDYSLKDSITVSGKVLTYSGIPLVEVNPEYSVSFRNSWSKSFGLSVKEVSGKTQTDEQGCFRFSFKPSEEITSKYKNGVYDVSVSVTDLAGETHDANLLIPVNTMGMILDIEMNGYHNSKIRTKGYGPTYSILTNKDSVTSLTVNATNLSGVRIESEGMLYFYKLPSPQLPINGDSKLIDYDLVEESDESQFEKYFYKQMPFVSGKKTALQLSDYPSGEYVIKAVCKNGLGEAVDTKETIVLYSFKDKKVPIATPDWVVVKDSFFTPDKCAQIQIGTGAEKAHILMEITSGEDIIEKKFFTLSNEIKTIDIPYKKEYQQGVEVSFIMIWNERFYQKTASILLKQPDRRLKIKTAVFRDKLTPGQQEEWKFTIQMPDGSPAKAQFMAELYDASLDVIHPHKWIFNPFKYNVNPSPYWQQSPNLYPCIVYGSWNEYAECTEPASLVLRDFGIQWGIERREGFTKRLFGRKATNGNVPAPVIMDYAVMESVGMDNASAKKSTVQTGADEGEYRTNLDETAFFFPKLQTDTAGNIIIRFIVPEALTQWKFQGLATTPQMEWAMIENTAVTSKPFMVNPNLPRFVRQGDSICISTMIFNKTIEAINGEVRLELFNPSNDSVWFSLDEKMNSLAGKDTIVNFYIKIPDDMDLTGIRIKAGNDIFSDGEQHLLPVLPSRTLVTETMSMSVLGKQDKEYRFERFMNRKSHSLTNYRYTVEYCGNPAWYAIEALPALNQSIPNNANGAMSSLFVSAVASYLAESVSPIREAVRSWEKQMPGESGLVSSLEKNESLKQILLTETPWVLAAATENENMHSLSLLFDVNRQRNIREESVATLSSLQNEDGGFSWFPGMGSSFSLTLNILQNQYRLTLLDAIEYNENEKMIQYNAIRYLDNIMGALYDNEFESNKPFIPTTDQMRWAYLRSLSMDIPFTGNSLPVHKEILRYMKGDPKRLSLYECALSALSLNQYGFIEDARKIVSYLISIATRNEIQGMYWANNRADGFSSVNSIQTHVMIMNAIMSVEKNNTFAENMKLWLLRQKQTTQWESVPATVEAIYALLLNGGNWLSSSENPIVKVGSETLEFNRWFGYGKRVFENGHIGNSEGVITIRQNENHSGWGAAYWQYFEDFDLIKNSANGFMLQKQLFVVKESVTGKELFPITDHVNIGDLIVTRFVITADRDYDFVVMKDQRASCLEPVLQLSQNRYEQGIGYYLETKDPSTNYFFERLPKGTYVFEYQSRVSQQGFFNEGISSIQCLYAPEYIANTQGVILNVK